MPQFEILECSNKAVIKVLGVGGGGNNAVEHMLTSTGRSGIYLFKY